MGEADRILTIYTKKRGKIRVIAKGVRKIGSRKGGNVELFNRILFYITKARVIDIMTEVIVLDSFAGWRKNLGKVAIAYSLCELADRLSPEESPHQEMYDILRKYLEKLSSFGGKSSHFPIDQYAAELIINLGFWPAGKPFPAGFDYFNYAEELSERKIKSRDFLKVV